MKEINQNIKPLKILGKNYNGIRSEEGYTLIELLVSLVLFVGVIGPALALLIFMVLQKKGEYELLPLTVAQQAMEETLFHRDFETETYFVHQNRWRVERKVIQEERLVTIEIQVFLREREKPLTTLITARVID